MSRDYELTSRIDKNSFTHHGGGQFKTPDGAEIYFEEIGDPLRPVMILLHGGIGTMEDFNPILPILLNHFQIIGIDSRGHGKSTLGKNVLTYKQIEDDVVGLLLHHKIEEVEILGFSDGGIVGFRLASRPELKVKKLITIGAHWHPKNLANVIEIYNRITPESWKNKFPETYEIYQKLNPEPNWDHFVKSTLEMWKDTGPSGYPGDEIKKIPSLTVVIHGENDHLYSKADAEECAAKIQNSKFVELKDLGHELPRIDQLLAEW